MNIARFGRPNPLPLFLLLAPAAALVGLSACAAPAARSAASAASAPAPVVSVQPVGYEYRKVEQLIAARNYAAAERAADSHLATHPRDPQMRLLKSRVLVAQGKPDQALSLLQAVTQEFPEIPEPFNNLAVLYAQRGQIDLAHDALQQALRLRPHYATARENLGDLYRRMAVDQYRQALALNPGSATLKSKLAQEAP